MASSSSLPQLVTNTTDVGPELGRFLAAKRARLQPHDAGLPEGTRRRVPGLRREEVALLAGVSPAYYTRLEQGDSGRASTEVITALAQALQLSAAETEHLFHLTDPRRRSSCDTPTRPAVRPAMQSLLNAMPDVPAMIVGRRAEILTWNSLGSAVFGHFDELAPRDRNWARLVFLDPRFGELFVDWNQKAGDVVSQLRMDAGRHPDDRGLASLVGELAVKSPLFAKLWAAHEVRDRCHGTVHLDHADAGLLELQVESFRLAGDDDKSLVTYHAAPGSRSQEQLRLLGSWRQPHATSPCD